MFRRERPPCAGESPNDRASPPRHTPLQLVSSFCCFPTTVYMQPGSLFISWERRSRPLCTLPVRSVYHLGLCLSTTLPRLSSRHHRMIPCSPSLAVRVVYSSHSALLLSIIIRQKSNDSIRHSETLPFLSLLSSLDISSLVSCKCAVCAPQQRTPFLLKMVVWEQPLYYCVWGVFALPHYNDKPCSLQALCLQWCRL